MGNIFFVLLYQPLYNLLAFLGGLAPWGGLGLAIVLVTLFVKGIVMPLTYKSLKAQKEMQEIQPKIAAIKAEFKDDKERLAKELMGVYKTHNVNPFASCLPTVVQLFVFIALYQVLRAGIGTIDTSILYPFVANPGILSHMFLGIDLSRISIVLAVLSAVAQFVQAKQLMTQRPPKEVRTSPAALDEDMTASMNKTMVYVLPVVMLVIGVTTLPGGLTLYILVSSLMQIALQMTFLRKPKATTIVIDVPVKTE